MNSFWQLISGQNTWELIMFQMAYKSTGKPITVHGIDKSGTKEEQIKFLVYNNGWKWELASNLVPASPIRFEPTITTGEKP